MRHALLRTGPLLLALALPSAATFGCARDDLEIGAAASLAEAFRELAADYAATGAPAPALHLAASGVLEAQIRAGAPIEVFASASPDEPAALHADALVEAPVEFARNALVVAVAEGRDAPPRLEALAGEPYRRIAVGSPATVPSGRYARQAIERAGLAEALAGRLVPCENVRQALAYLERGEVQAAFLYATDLAASDRRLEALPIDAGLHDPIRYHACVTRVAGGRVPPHAFLRYLLSEEGQSILRRHGFRPPGAGA